MQGIMSLEINRGTGIVKTKQGSMGERKVGKYILGIRNEVNDGIIWIW